MFVACGIWCLADVSSIRPSSEQTTLSYAWFVFLAGMFKPLSSCWTVAIS